MSQAKTAGMGSIDGACLPAKAGRTFYRHTFIHLLKKRRHIPTESQGYQNEIYFSNYLKNKK